MKCEPCVNDYYQISIPSSIIGQQALPGQYVVVNRKFPVYIMGSLSNIELLIPNTLKEMCEKDPALASNLALQGTPLPVPDPKQFNLVLAENDGLSACIFYLKKYRHHFNGLVLIGTDQKFPFKPCPSRHLIPGMPPDIIAALPLLEDWGIAHRLASSTEMPGVYQGSVHDLAKVWQKKISFFVNIITIPALLQTNTQLTQ